MEKKRKKKGHVAIPFLLAFLLGIIGIGGIAMYIFSLIGGSDDEIQKMNSNITKPTAENNMTLLFVLDEEDDPEPLTFLLARVRPMEKEIMLVSIPSNMLSVVDGKQNTLAGFYNNGGIQKAEAAIIQETKIDPDRYIILDSEAFQKICNIFAGVYYQVPAGTSGFTESTDPQYLGPAQMEKLMTYPMFENGEMQRSVIAADLVTSMINQTDYDRIVSSMDSNFTKLINMMETDISAIDYKNQKNALKYMFTYGNEIAVFQIAMGESGDEEGDTFILNSDFYEVVAEYFEETEEAAGTEE